LQAPVAVILLYLLLQMFRSANPVCAGPLHQDRRRRVALAVAAFTGVKGELAVAIRSGILRRRAARLVAVRGLRVRRSQRDVRRWRATLAGPGVAGPFAVLDMSLDHDSGQALRPDRGPDRMPATRSTNSTWRS